MSIEGTEISSYSYDKLIFVEGVKAISWGKNSAFNKWCLDNWITTCRNVNLDPASHFTQKLTQDGL